jgi:hypothetical protein
LSWKSTLIERLGPSPGRLVTAAIYALGGKFYSRWLYQSQATAGNNTGRITISFDIDYPEDVQALEPLCALLDRHGITASFAVVGALVERYPGQHRHLVERGHELLNHTQNHPDNELLCPDRTFDQLSIEERAGEIRRCTEVCRDLLGVELKGFRAPHFGNVTGRDFHGLLAGQGYTFSSSVVAPGTPSAGLPYRTASGIWEFPVSTCPRHPFAVLDTWHALRKRGARHTAEGEFATLCRESVRLAQECGGYLNLYLDPRDVLEFEQAARGLAELAPGNHGLRLNTYTGHLDELTAR